MWLLLVYETDRVVLCFVLSVCLMTKCSRGTVFAFLGVCTHVTHEALDWTCKAFIGSVHPNNRKCIHLPVVVYSRADSCFGLVCPGFKISKPKTVKQSHLNL